MSLYSPQGVIKKHPKPLCRIQTWIIKCHVFTYNNDGFSLHPEYSVEIKV